MSIKVVAAINGIHAAFDSVGRNRDSRPRVCTSLSIYVIVDGKAVYHILLDCGPGVPAAILENDRFPKRQPDVLLLSHSHADHVLGIDALVGTRRRQWISPAGSSPPKLKLISVKETFEQAIRKYFGHLESSLDFAESAPNGSDNAVVNREG